MPHGLEVYNTYNEPIVTIIDRLTKVIHIGVYPMTSQNNSFSIQDPAFLTGYPFVHSHMSNRSVVLGTPNPSESYTCLYVNHVLNNSTLTVNYGYTTYDAFAYGEKNPQHFIIGVY